MMTISYPSYDKRIKKKRFDDSLSERHYGDSRLVLLVEQSLLKQ